MSLNFQQISDLYLMNNNIILGIKREATNAKCTAMPLNKHLSICKTPKCVGREREFKEDNEKCGMNAEQHAFLSFVCSSNTNCIPVRFVGVWNFWDRKFFFKAQVT
jgi:hypothetical protein